VLISTFSRIQSDPEKTMAAFARLLLFGSVLSMPVLLIMHVLPQEFLTVICFVKQNSAWIAAASLLRWLAVMGIVYVFTTFSASVWLAQGKVIASIGVSAAMCITVIAAIAVGAHWGMQGICIGLFLRSIIVFPFYVYINYRITRIRAGYYIKTLLPSLVAGAVMAMLLFGMHRFIPGDSLQRHFGTLAGGAIIGIAAYAGILFLFFKDAIKQLKETLERLMPQMDTNNRG
jgi:PST family polysaccharide transporter